MLGLLGYKREFHIETKTIVAYNINVVHFLYRQK